MTDKELTEYLIEVGGLVNGYTGQPITDVNFFETSPGWNRLIKNLIEDLINLGWDREVCQVKEKFGGLRFYINDGTDAIHKRITEAETASYTICEVTGDAGQLRTDISWYRTLSEKEYLNVKQYIQNRANNKLF